MIIRIILKKLPACLRRQQGKNLCKPRQVCWVMKNTCKYSINLKNRQNERCYLQFYPAAHDDTHRVDCLMCHRYYWRYVR